nr:MFS transporter [Rothia sp. ZJ1223]
MPAIVATFALAISGLSLLLPATPAWVVSGGAGSLGAGLTTATLMGCTVATQLCMPRILRRWGWTRVLVTGALLMGLPAPLQAFSPNLGLVLVSSGLRGVGFGILTVCASTALTLLIPAEARGRAVGLYGLAAAGTQMILTPLAPWLVELWGFRPVLVLGVLPALGVPFAYKLGKLVDALPPQPVRERQAGGSVLSRIWPALLTLTLTTSAGGAFMTFADQLSPSASAAAVALLVLTVMATPTRLYGGGLTDRFGTRVLMSPVLALTAVGLLLISFSTREPTPDSRLVLLLGGVLLLGFGYGFLQSVTMVRAFADSEGETTRASVAWNVNFDVGTGLGGLMLGALMQVSTASTAWLLWAALLLVTAVLLGFKDARERQSAGR